MGRLGQSLGEIWRWVETNELPNGLSDLVRDCDKQAPDTTVLSSIYTSAALDAANSISITLESLKDANEDRAVEVASLARDTVDLFVQQHIDLDPNDPSLERLIVENPLMQVELQVQMNSLELLENWGNERSIVSSAMRQRFSNGSLPEVSAPIRN